MPDRRHRARSLRNNATEAERTLWRVLSAYRPRFTRQLSVSAYTADLACRKARLIVELDGSQHVDNAQDAHRTAALEALGWRVIRFWNGEVMNNVQGVAEAIIVAATPRLPPGLFFEAVAPRRRKEGPPPTPPANAGGE